MQRFFFFFLYLWLAISTTEASAQHSLKRVETTHAKSADVIRLDFNAAPEYKYFTLTKPDRLVVDVNHAIWPKGVITKNTLSYIKSVRHAQRGKHLRIVFDTKQPIHIHKHRIRGKHSVELTIKPGKTVARTSRVSKKSTPTPKPKKIKKRKPLIVLDAGHGGKDPGAIGRRKTKEKHITLGFTKALKDELLATKRYRVYLTRSRDVYVPLQTRVNKAQKVKGDVFMSIHADSAHNRKAQGFSVYTLSERASDKEAAALARKENYGFLSDEITISPSNEVNALLVDLVQRDTKNISSSFAETIVDTMRGKIRILPNTHRFAGFRVLTAPNIPSVLVELGYLSNSREEKLLKSKKHKKKLVKLLRQAIDTHFRKHPVQ